MPNFTNWAESVLIGHTLLGSTLATPSAIHVGIYNTVTDDGSVINEVASGTAYARMTIVFSPPSEGVCSNKALVTFPTATTWWGYVQGLLICDTIGIGAGNIFYYLPFTNPQTIGNGNIVQLAAGQVNVQYTGNWSHYLRQALLGMTLCASPFSVVSSRAAAIFTSLQSLGTTVVEPPSVTGYARQAVSFGSPISGVTRSNSEVAFGPVTTIVGTISYMGIYDTVGTAGNLLVWMPLPAARYLDSGYRYVVPSSMISIEYD